MLTTTYGTGEVLKAALDHGYRKFILAIGGSSATNDGGAGMLQALGMRLLDRRESGWIWWSRAWSYRKNG